MIIQYLKLKLGKILGLWFWPETIFLTKHKFSHCLIPCLFQLEKIVKKCIEKTIGYSGRFIRNTELHSNKHRIVGKPIKSFQCEDNLRYWATRWWIISKLYNWIYFLNFKKEKNLWMKLTDVLETILEHDFIIIF